MHLKPHKSIQSQGGFSRFSFALALAWCVYYLLRHRACVCSLREGTVCDASAAQMCQSNRTIWFSTIKKKTVINFIPVLCCFNECEFLIFSPSSFRTSSTLALFHLQGIHTKMRRSASGTEFPIRNMHRHSRNGNRECEAQAVMLINCFCNAALDSRTMWAAFTRSRYTVCSMCAVVLMRSLKFCFVLPFAYSMSLFSKLILFLYSKTAAEIVMSVRNRTIIRRNTYINMRQRHTQSLAHKYPAT